MPNSFFRFREFTVHQESCAMKVGTDATLLGAWTQVPEKPYPKVLDIGTGTGIIALMVAQRFRNAIITGIDIDKEAARQAMENAENSPFRERITIIHSPLQRFNGGKFDAIVCNPPYFSDSLKCPDPKRTVSRHTDSLTYGELMHHVYETLADGGEFSVIYPAEYRQEIESEAAIAGLFKKRECGIRTTVRKSERRVMAAFTKEPQSNPETAGLIIGDTEHQRMMEAFYL